MVWKGQMIAIPVEPAGIVLEGVWQAGSGRGAVVAPPHPEYGGSLESPVVNEIAFALYREGFASVRFNWRGVGGSQGVRTGDPKAAEEDYAAAVEHLERTLGAPLCGAGYSFGAATAMRVALHDPRVRELLLVAPPVAMLRSLPIERYEGPIHAIVGGRDEFAPVDQLSELLSPLPNARIDVIPGADHFFSTTGLGDLSQLIRAAR